MNIVKRLSLLVSIVLSQLAAQVVNPPFNGSGGGSGSVTSVTVAGTANQITVSGTCNITTTGTCTLSIPSVLTLPGTINKITITEPATGATFTIANNKTFTVSNTLTFTGTDTSSVAFGAGGTVLYTAALIPTSPNGSITWGNTGTAAPTADVSTTYLNASYVQLIGGTLTGKLTAPPLAGIATFSCGAGSDPSSPVASDIWCTSASVFTVYDGAITRRMISNTAGQDLRALSTGFAKITTTTGAFTTQTAIASADLNITTTTCTYPSVLTAIGATGLGTCTVPTIPLTSKSADYTLVLGDAGTSIYHPAADTNNRTFTIPANASVAYPIGTVITFTNYVNTVTIAITSDTMFLAGNIATTGSRTLAAGGIATATKLTSTLWIINGTGLT